MELIPRFSRRNWNSFLSIPNSFGSIILLGRQGQKTDSHFKKLLLLKPFRKWMWKPTYLVRILWFVRYFYSVVVWLLYVSYVKGKIYLPKRNFKGIEKELRNFLRNLELELRYVPKKEFGIGIEPILTQRNWIWINSFFQRNWHKTAVLPDQILL